MSCEKLSLLRDAFFARLFAVSAGHAASTNLCKFCSAFAAGSVATTSKPCARNSAAQLAPITPVPTIAIFFTGLLSVIVLSTSGGAVVSRPRSLSSIGKRLDQADLLDYSKNQAVEFQGRRAASFCCQASLLGGGMAR